MATRKDISFVRTDYSIPNHIEEYAKEYADHFKVRRVYVPQFCRLIQTSKYWNSSNLQDKLSAWEANFSRIPGTYKIVDLVNRSFSSCQNKEEIDHLRGAMVEALVIGFNGGTKILTKANFGWGARVDIKIDSTTLQVKYQCTDPMDEKCSRRSTVDFGSWDGYNGKFYECKAHPAGVGCKELKYMGKLKETLSLNNISHEVFFVCAESRDSVQMRLEELGLGPLYKAYGTEDILTLMPA